MESQFAEENTIKTCSTSVLSRVVVLTGPQDHFRWYTRSKLFSTQVYVLCLFLCADIAMIVHSNGRKNWGNLGSKQGSGTKPCRSNRILHYQALRAKKKKKKILDEAVKIINCIIFLPLSPCLFIIPCDKIRSMNAISRKGTCVIVVSSTTDLFHSKTLLLKGQ